MFDNRSSSSLSLSFSLSRRAQTRINPNQLGCLKRCFLSSLSRSSRLSPVGITRESNARQVNTMDYRSRSSSVVAILLLSLFSRLVKPIDCKSGGGHYSSQRSLGGGAGGGASSGYGSVGANQAQNGMYWNNPWLSPEMYDQGEFSCFPRRSMTETSVWNDSDSIPDEQRLMAQLLRNYDPSARPVYNASNTVSVAFGIALTQLSDMVREHISRGVTILFDRCQSERERWLTRPIPLRFCSLDNWISSILIESSRLVFSSQDEKNQVLTTNIWLEQVRCRRRRSFEGHSSIGSRNGTINAWSGMLRITTVWQHFVCPARRFGYPILSCTIPRTITLKDTIKARRWWKTTVMSFGLHPPSFARRARSTWPSFHSMVRLSSSWRKQLERRRSFLLD